MTARAVIVLDESDNVKYVELVSEITKEPNYDAALGSLSDWSGDPGDCLENQPNGTDLFAKAPSIHQPVMGKVATGRSSTAAPAATRTGVSCYHVGSAI